MHALLKSRLTWSFSMMCSTLVFTVILTHNTKKIYIMIYEWKFHWIAHVSITNITAIIIILTVVIAEIDTFCVFLLFVVFYDLISIHISYLWWFGDFTFLVLLADEVSNIRSLSRYFKLTFQKLSTFCNIFRICCDVWQSFCQNMYNHFVSVATFVIIFIMFLDILSMMIMHKF